MGREIKGLTRTPTYATIPAHIFATQQGEALLDQISDAVFRLDDLLGALPALEVIFSAV
jgi:hypothetical protein